ncbi:hypothetical protein LCGC14_1162260 [marine sediment metagenome]|uniref:Uncharacterized protein n=1 Tax=marine sediment metagenome TaxID=412755 RepID=A0A0F9PXW4_9ZZZZ
MNFRAEIKERFDRLEKEVRELTGEVRTLVKIAEKRDEVEAQVRAVQVADPSNLYEKEYKEEEDEDLAGEIVNFGKRKEKA